MEKKNRNVRIISGTTEDIAEMLIELLVDENEKDKFKSKIDEYNNWVKEHDGLSPLYAEKNIE